MQWAISKRSCDAMRTDEMRKDSTFKRRGIRLKLKRLLLRSTGGLPGTYRHSLSLRSIGYKRFKFETSAPSLPGYYLYFIYIYVKTYHWSTHFQTRAWLLPFVTRMWIQPVGRQSGPVLSDGRSSKAVTMPKVRPRRDRSRWAENKMNKSRHVKTLHMHHLPAHLPLIWSLGNVAKDLRGLLTLILQQYTKVT